MARRSQKKPPFISAKLLKKVLSLKASKGRRPATIKTYSRSSYIYPDCVGLDIAVYNGRQFIVVKITEEKVGHKLGEFSPTRKAPSHKEKNNKKINK